MTNYRRKKSSNYNKVPTKQFNINRSISSSQVRIIDDQGNMLGVFDTKEALKMAEEKELDLIEINPKALPPIVKLIEYTKFKYQQDKAEKTKPKLVNEIKILRVSVRISVHDLLVQAKKADEFLSKDIKVKLQVQMRGREKQFPEVAQETMKKFLELVTFEYSFENEPKLLGDSDFCIIKPKKAA